MTVAPHTSAPRFASVDALRGLTVAAMLVVNNAGDWDHVYPQLAHARWHGFTFADLIFPTFLFVVGVSIALSVVPRAERGDSGLHRAILERTARIVALGLLINFVAWCAQDGAWFRPWGVLQRIGLCFAIAGILALHARAMLQWVLIAVLLVGYWALLAPGGFEPWTNLVARVDTATLGPMLLQYKPETGQGMDPEGMLSTLPAIATTLLGLRAGAWLRADATTRLLWVGVLLLVAGQLWGLDFPINKRIWSSSFVLWCGGLDMLMLAAFHWLVDEKGTPAIGRSFGMNAITAYAGSELLMWLLEWTGWHARLYRGLFAGWMTPLAGPFLPSLTYALANMLLWWPVVRTMLARRVFIKL